MNYIQLVSPGVGGGGGGGGSATLIRPTPPTNKPIALASQPIKIKAMPIAPNQTVRGGGGESDREKNMHHLLY